MAEERGPRFGATAAPADLYVGVREVASRGWHADGWIVEETPAVARFALRVREKLDEERSAFQRIEVWESDFFGRVLTLDGTLMLTERDEFSYHELLVHVPLCALPEPRRVLVVGGGDCGCLREVLAHETVEHVVQCDIDEGVTRVAERWFPWVGDALADPRAEVVFEDGADLVARHEDAFDAILVDATDPRGPGAVLFSRRFYAAAARALRPGGVLAAQTESPAWDAPAVGTIYGELGAVFERVAPYLGWIPVYAGGCWSFAFASDSRGPHDDFDEARARDVAAHCLYYNPEVHRAAFALPTFARRAVAGDNPFRARDERAARRRAAVRDQE